MIRITRITEITANSSRPVLRVEARIVGAWVDLLEAICREAGAWNPQAAVLDLSGVTFASAAGVSLLRRLEGAGIALRGCPGHLRDLCDGQ